MTPAAERMVKDAEKDIQRLLMDLEENVNAQDPKADFRIEVVRVDTRMWANMAVEILGSHVFETPKE